MTNFNGITFEENYGSTGKDKVKDPKAKAIVSIVAVPVTVPYDKTTDRLLPNNTRLGLFAIRLFNLKTTPLPTIALKQRLLDAIADNPNDKKITSFDHLGNNWTRNTEISANNLKFLGYFENLLSDYSPLNLPYKPNQQIELSMSHSACVDGGLSNEQATEFIDLFRFSSFSLNGTNDNMADPDIKNMQVSVNKYNDKFINFDTKETINTYQALFAANKTIAMKVKDWCLSNKVISKTYQNQMYLFDHLDEPLVLNDQNSSLDLVIIDELNQLTNTNADNIYEAIHNLSHFLKTTFNFNLFHQSTPDHKIINLDVLQELMIEKFGEQFEAYFGDVAQAKFTKLIKLLRLLIDRNAIAPVFNDENDTLAMEPTTKIIGATVWRLFSFFKEASGDRVSSQYSGQIEFGHMLLKYRFGKHSIFVSSETDAKNAWFGSPEETLERLSTHWIQQMCDYPETYLNYLKSNNLLYSIQNAIGFNTTIRIADGYTNEKAINFDHERQILTHILTERQ